MLKVELGGGRNPLRKGFVNVDKENYDTVQYVVDIEKERLPFASEEVDVVYSAHCLEHVKDLKRVFNEIARVCKIGASVEIHAPHWLCPTASMVGHEHVLCERILRRICGEYARDWWLGQRRFEFVKCEYVKEVTFFELRPLFPQMTDEQVMKYIPDCSHEVLYFFLVVPNEHYTP